MSQRYWLFSYYFYDFSLLFTIHEYFEMFVSKFPVIHFLFQYFFVEGMGALNKKNVLLELDPQGVFNYLTAHHSATLNEETISLLLREYHVMISG